MSTNQPSEIMGRRNAKVLAVCQGLFICAIAADLTLTGITGYQLAPNKALATLPFALITVGAAVVTVFAAMLMARIGRRIGFALGALCGTLGGLISVWAIFHADFWLFCIGTALVGAFQGFAQYYSLAAADSVGADHKARAISTVLTGGVLAAIAGPALANWASTLFDGVQFAGSYLMVAGLALASAALVLSLYRDVEPIVAAGAVDAPPPRPLREIAAQPNFVMGLTATVTGSVTMLFVMTASPLAAVACGFSIGDGASIIQFHLMGMFVPSFFSGRLVERFGVPKMLLAGIALITLCISVAASSQALAAFYVALFAVGMGWNFMMVSGTTLIARSYRPNERGKTQAMSGLSGNLAATMATLSAGAVLQGVGWTGLNLAIVPVILLFLGITAWWLRGQRRELGLA